MIFKWGMEFSCDEGKKPNLLNFFSPQFLAQYQHRGHHFSIISKREHDLKDFQLSIFKVYSLGQRDLTEFIVKMFIWERGENEGGPIKQVKRTCF